MKSRIPLLFFIISFLVSHTAYTQENLDQTKMVTLVFKAFKKQDKNIVLKSLPSKKDIKYIIPIAQKARPNKHIPEADSIIANFKIELTKNFNKETKIGSSVGVVWEDIVLQDVSYEANPDPNIDIERGNFILECTSHDKRFRLTLRKCYKIHDTWRVMNTIKFTLL